MNLQESEKHLKWQAEEIARLRCELIFDPLKWIDLKDKLPDFDVTVLCYDPESEGNHYHLARLEDVVTRRGGKSLEWAGEWAGWNFTHWMQLEPPKNIPQP